MNSITYPLMEALKIAGIAGIGGVALKIAHNNSGAGVAGGKLRVLFGFGAPLNNSSLLADYDCVHEKVSTDFQMTSRLRLKIQNNYHALQK